MKQKREYYMTMYVELILVIVHKINNKQLSSLTRYDLLLINSFLAILLLQFLIANNLITFFAFAQAQQQQQQTSIPVTLIPSITQNILTIVSFLIGTSSFILGLRIQNLSRPIQQTPSKSPIIYNEQIF